MKFDLNEIVHHPGMHSVQEIEDTCPDELGIECSKPVKGKLDFTNTGTLLLVSGNIETEVKLECGRCLADFTYPVEAQVEEEFRIEQVGDSMRALPFEEEDVDTEMVKNNILDLQELVRQSLLLVLPIQPLCKPECAGICPTCGEDRNVGKCICPPADVQSPFSVLADLLEEENQEKEENK